MWWFPGLAVLTGFAFLGYGVACLRSEHMRREFERFGLGRFRRVTGLLEVAGGAGLVLGLWYLPLLSVSAVGLSLLMLLAVLTRLRLRDRLVIIGPAFVLLLVNGSLAVEAWRRLRA
jgi:hypothetical protein